MRDILKAAAKSGAASIATALLGVVSSKILALGVGPAGIGLFSILVQTLQAAGVIATVGGASAVVQGVASREGRDRDEYLATVAAIFLVGSVLVAVALLVGAPWLAGMILDRSDPEGVALLRWLALPVALTSGVALVTSVLNAHVAVGRLAVVNVLASCFVAALAYPCAALAAKGQPLALLVLASVATVATITVGGWMALREGWLRVLQHGWTRSIRPEAARAFLRLAATLLVTGAATTGTLLFIRAMLAKGGGMAAAGLFSASWAISLTYMMALVTVFGTFYLPTLSKAQEPEARADLVRRMFRIATLISMPLIVTVVAFKPMVVQILYSQAFMPATETMRWLLLGDYFKVGALVLITPMVALGDSRRILACEILFNLVFLGGSAWSVRVAGHPEGIGVAYLAGYIGYFLYGVRYLGAKLESPLGRAALLPWLCGLAAIVLASALTWDARAVDPAVSGVLVVCALALTWLAVTPPERAALIDIVRRRMPGARP